MKDLRLAKAAPEHNVFLVGDLLPGEHQHQILHPCIVHGAEGLGIRWRTHINAAHLGAESRMQRTNIPLG